MTTFPDVGKEINDQFSKDIAKEQTVELTATGNKFVSFALKGKVKTGAVDGTFAPTVKLTDYNVEIKPEFSTPDDKGKTYKVEVVGTDPFSVKGLKVDFGLFNGAKGEFYLSGAYKNSKFGGVTGRITFPEGKDKFITPSLYLETPDTKGFGIGGTSKINLGETAAVESWKALLSYKSSESDFNGYFGFEKKPDEPKKKPENTNNEKPKSVSPPKPQAPPPPPSKSLHVVGGFVKKFDKNKKLVALNGSLNTSNQEAKVQLLFRKNYENGTFTKIHGDFDGNVGVARQFKPQSGVNIILGTGVNVWNGEGNVGFHFATEL